MADPPPANRPGSPPAADPLPTAQGIPMPEPRRPSGTVTFLFTDIEGSTKRWQTYPEAMGAAVARHDALLRAEIERREGYVFKTVGGAFCAAFPTVPLAVAAALAAQRDLAAADWGEPGPIWVRMAVHVGAAEERAADYFGPAVNRVARLLSAGHGGQVLLSLPAAELARDSLAHDVVLRDLGEHRLKDLARPERIFQLLAPDLPADFPPLATLDHRPHNLPLQPTPFLGREREVAEVMERLGRPDVRLLTLTGPGGTGKTRLSLQVAAELLDGYPDGAWFVPLEEATDDGLVVAGITQSLGVREGGGSSPLEVLLDYLRPKQLLLVLDNFEQVAHAAPLVAKLLQAASGLKVLVTSRVRLGVGEHVFPVPPLGLPPRGRALPDPTELARYEAVRLFLDRAQAAKAGFALTAENAAAVARICADLDGLPLAIELAAARVRLLPPQAMAKRLEDRLGLPVGGGVDVAARRQTLRGAIAWSLDLLPPDLQALFARLAVFAGGWTFEAAEAVADPGDGSDLLEGLEALVDHSLVRLEETAEGQPRYAMLATIRAFARERLEQMGGGEAELMRQLHAEHYLALGEEAEPVLRGGPSQRPWLDRLELERDNLRAALAWAGDHAPETAARIGATLWRLWSGHDFANAEAVTELQRGLALLNRIPDDAERMQTELGLQMALGLTLMKTRGYAAPEVHEAFDRARDLCQAFGDVPQLVPALSGLTTFYLVHADLDEARELADQQVRLAEQIEDAGLRLQSLLMTGVIAFFMGEFDQARTRLEHVLSAYDPDRYAADSYVYGHETASAALSYLSMTLCLLGFPDLALERSREGIELGTRFNHPLSLARNLNEAAVLRQMRREPEEARAQAQQGLDHSSEHGIVLWMALGTALLGWATAASGDPRAGVDLLRNGIAGYRATGARLGVPNMLTLLAEALDLDGSPADAHEAIDEAIELAEMTKDRMFLAEAQRLKGALLLKDGQADAGERMLKAALDTATEQGARWFALRAGTDLARLWRARGDDAGARDLLADVLQGRSEGADTVDMRAAQELWEALSQP